MKIILIILVLFLKFNSVLANDLFYFLESAYKNNPKLKAERENLKSIKENINISRGEFLPSISLSGSVESLQSTERTNQAGTALNDSSQDKETKTISIDQKLFQGFEGFNSLKKSELEFKQANFILKNAEQETIYRTINSYFNLIYKTKSKKFNFANVDLFEQQVESDSIRMQKGEITLTDLAQSESSLAGARANFIAAETELLTSKTNLERIARTSIPDNIEEELNVDTNLPNNLLEALNISEKNSPKILIAKLDYEISKKNLNIEKARLSPSASINYSKTKTNDFSTTINKNDQEALKATVSWPIIKGGKNYASIKKSQFKKKQSNLILQDVINEVKTDTANAWSVYQSAQSVLNSTLSQVKAAEIANEGITMEYDSGNTRTTLDVIQSRSLLLNAKITNAKAERDFIVSKFKLSMVIGRLSLNSIKRS
jgi:outer membrane protein